MEQVLKFFKRFKVRVPHGRGIPGQFDTVIEQYDEIFAEVKLSDEERNEISEKLNEILEDEPFGNAFFESKSKARLTSCGFSDEVKEEVVEVFEEYGLVFEEEKAQVKDIADK